MKARRNHSTKIHAPKPTLMGLSVNGPVGWEAVTRSAGMNDPGVPIADTRIRVRCRFRSIHCSSHDRGPAVSVDHGYHVKEHCPPLCRSNASNSKPKGVISPSTGTDPRFRRVNIDNKGTASWAGGSYDFLGCSLISRIR